MVSWEEASPGVCCKKKAFWLSCRLGFRALSNSSSTSNSSNRWLIMVMTGLCSLPARGSRVPVRVRARLGAWGRHTCKMTGSGRPPGRRGWLSKRSKGRSRVGARWLRRCKLCRNRQLPKRWVRLGLGMCRQSRK